MTRAHATAEVEISRTPEEVFAWLADYRTHSQWHPAVLSIASDADKLEMGARLHLVERLLGRRLESDMEVTAFDPPERIVLEGSAVAVEIRDELTLKDLGGRTLLRIDVQIETNGLFGEGLATFNQIVQRNLTTAVGMLKDQLEAHEDLHMAFGVLPAFELNG